MTLSPWQTNHLYRLGHSGNSGQLMGINDRYVINGLLGIPDHRNGKLSRACCYLFEGKLTLRIRCCAEQCAFKEDVGARQRSEYLMVSAAKQGWTEEGEYLLYTVEVEEA